MAGHSKWKQIKHKKGVADTRRSTLFAKLLKSISVAAKNEPDPNFNPRLRGAIEKAKENNVPSDNIQRAIQRASEDAAGVEELIIEAYGPEKSAFVITALTDNKNRTIAEMKHLLSKLDVKMAAQGSVTWGFTQPTPGEWQAQFIQSISDAAKEKIRSIVIALEEYDDVQNVFTNVNVST